MDNIFYGGGSNKADDLTIWCGRLKSIGWIISTLLFVDEPQAYETLHGVRDDLEGMILDYVGAIEHAIDDAAEVLHKFFEQGDVSLLGDLHNLQKRLEDGGLGPACDIMAAQEAIRAISEFMENDLQEIMRIKESLEATVPRLEKELKEQTACSKESTDH
jgi:hypothetical protein